MSIGITFDNIIDAQDYQKMLYMQGHLSELRHIAVGKYKVIPTKERTDKNFGSSSFLPVIGANTIATKDITKEFLEQQRKLLPTREKRRKMDIYAIPYDIDKEISNFIIDLRKHDFKTIGSCSGHVNLPGGKGFVTIKNKLTESQKEKIKDIAKNYNLNEVEFSETGITFKSLVPVKGITFNTRAEAKKYIDELEEKGHKAKLYQTGIYFTVYKDREYKE